MSESGPQGVEKAPSLARGRRGFTVAASPLNAVKLDLGIILILAVVLWLLVGRFVVAPAAQIGVLFAYGLAGMAWIVVRSRRALRRQGRG